MGRKVTVAVCSLNQWAMDFQGNYQRILESIQVAKEMKAAFRTGPELEVCGYGCNDHFHESDTFLHSWEALAELLKNPICHGMIIDIGMPIMHKNVAYNCRVSFLNKKLLLIRPKMILCDDLNYRETRWFTAWTKTRQLEDHFLPRMISDITGQKTVPFGDAVISTIDTCIGFEICEELWNPNSTHIPMGLDGVEIFVNGSASHHELQKTYVAYDLVKSASAKSGGIYMFTNLRGCDGERVFYTGNSMIAVNGFFVSMCTEFSLDEVEVATATVDLEDIRMYRNSIRSRNVQAARAPSYPRISVDFALSTDDDDGCIAVPNQKPIHEPYYTPEEEISLGPACWLWDYLRRSGQGGFLIPLSGGVDSAATACIVSCMCHRVFNAIQNGSKKVLADLQKIIGDNNYIPKSANEICNHILVTCFMATENSSRETRSRAQALSSEIGSYHLSISIDLAVAAIVGIFTNLTGFVPKFKAHGGSNRENLALQNIQARLRMILAYLFAQLILWVRGRSGGLLVLGAANVEEGLRGYLTKYDCSSADLSPTGGISKVDLKKFLKYVRTKFGYSSIDGILYAPSTAELEPLQEGKLTQQDEMDMGMSYSELALFGRLRKTYGCGPYSMFCKLVHEWKDMHFPDEIAIKVKHFFRCYAINRHKMTVITPAYHADTYSPDDNRYDHRQFLYDVKWSWQFRKIDEAVERWQTVRKFRKEAGEDCLEQAGNAPHSCTASDSRTINDFTNTASDTKLMNNRLGMVVDSEVKSVITNVENLPNLNVNSKDCPLKTNDCQSTCEPTTTQCKCEDAANDELCANSVNHSDINIQVTSPVRKRVCT